MFSVFGWLWAWWCEPAEMMRQRRQRLHWRHQLTAQVTLLKLEEERVRARHYTTMQLAAGSDKRWLLECTCGWSRMAFMSTDQAGKVRYICDQHDETHRD